MRGGPGRGVAVEPWCRGVREAGLDPARHVVVTAVKGSGQWGDGETGKGWGTGQEGVGLVSPYRASRPSQLLCLPGDVVWTVQGSKG